MQLTENYSQTHLIQNLFIRLEIHILLINFFPLLQEGGGVLHTFWNFSLICFYFINPSFTLLSIVLDWLSLILKQKFTVWAQLLLNLNYPSKRISMLQLCVIFSYISLGKVSKKRLKITFQKLKIKKVR